MSETDKPEGGDEDFASLLAEYEKESPTHRKLREPRVGEQVKGRVVSMGADAVFVDLGAKSEGMIDLAEVRDSEGRLTVKVGDTLEARVVETSGKSGCIVLRRALGRGPEAKAELEQAFAHQIPVDGTVSGVNKGGVEVQIAGVRAFCPISQLDSRHVEDASSYVGQKLQFIITRLEAGGRHVNLVVSRRTLLEREAKQKAAETRAHLSVGAVMRGTVTSIKDYGAFVDLGGLEGMLHISELGFSRVAHPRYVLAVGQQIEVQIIKLEKGDDPRRPEKISLSLKSLEKDPWEGAAERFPEGAKLQGTVLRVEPFGAFVEIAPGVEGLVHVSELGAGRKIAHAREVVKPGQTVEVTVLGVDGEKRRVSLSLVGRESEKELEEAVATHKTSTGPQRFGTFGDLLKGATPTKKK